MESIDLFVLLVTCIPLTIFCLVLIALIISNIIDKPLVSKICECILWWMTFSFILPGRAKKFGLLPNRLYGWLLALLSPPALATYGILFVMIFCNKPLSYEELKLTSRNEISKITDISNFPDFEYQSNKHYSWDGTTRIFYHFTDEKAATKLLTHIDSIIGSEDNIYWRKDSLYSKEDKDFFGSDYVYTCERGWDSLYVKGPKGIDNYSQVIINLQKKGFSMIFSSCVLWGLEDYAIPDSLNKLTGVKFPPLEFVNGKFEDYFVDSGWEATAKMENKPSKLFLNSLKNAKYWEESYDGKYSFHLIDRKSNFWEDIVVDPNSRYIKFSRASY